MTAVEVKNLIHLIRAYYPQQKILDNELEVAIWKDEFKDLNKDIAIKAVREVCRKEENSLKVNIAAIRNKYEELTNEIKWNNQIYSNMRIEDKLDLTTEEIERRQKKLNNAIKKLQGV